MMIQKMKIGGVALLILLTFSPAWTQYASTYKPLLRSELQDSLDAIFTRMYTAFGDSFLYYKTEINALAGLTRRTLWVTDFGAVDDSVTVCTSEIQTAIDSAKNGDVVYAPYLNKGRYVVDDTLEINGKNITILGDVGVTFYQSSPSAGLVFYAYGDSVNGGSMSDSLMANLESIYTNMSVTEGNLLSLTSTSDWYWDNGGGAYHKGELHEICRDDGFYVRIMGNTWDKYDTLIDGVSLEEYRPIKVKFQDFDIEYPITTVNAGGIKITWGKNCILDNIGIKNAAEYGVTLERCFRSLVHNCSFIRTNKVGFGYGVVLSSSYYSKIDGCFFHEFRHGITHGSSTGWYPARGTIISNNHFMGGGKLSSGSAIWPDQSSVDLHGPGEMLQINDNFINGTYHGVIVRGDNIDFSHNTCTGRVGYLYYQYDGSNARIKGNTYDPHIHGRTFDYTDLGTPAVDQRYYQILGFAVFGNYADSDSLSNIDITDNSVTGIYNYAVGLRHDINNLFMSGNRFTFNPLDKAAITYCFQSSSGSPYVISDSYINDCSFRNIRGVFGLKSSAITLTNTNANYYHVSFNSAVSSYQRMIGQTTADSIDIIKAGARMITAVSGDTIQVKTENTNGIGLRIRNDPTGGSSYNSASGILELDNSAASGHTARACGWYYHSQTHNWFSGIPYDPSGAGNYGRTYIISYENENVEALQEKVVRLDSIPEFQLKDTGKLSLYNRDVTGKGLVVYNRGSVDYIGASVQLNSENVARGAGVFSYHNASVAAPYTATGDSMTWYAGTPYNKGGKMWGVGYATDKTPAYAFNSAAANQSLFVIDNHGRACFGSDNATIIGNANSTLYLYKISPAANYVQLKIGNSGDTNRFSVDEDGDVAVDGSYAGTGLAMSAATTTWGVGNVVSSLKEKVSLTDTGELSLAANVAGMGRVVAGNNVEWAIFTFTTVGAVTLCDSSANVSTVNDADTKMNIYDGGDHVVVENQLGSTLSFLVVVDYITP